jgi:hypothetical protein
MGTDKMKKSLYKTIRIILFISIFMAIMRLMNYCLVQSNWASIDRWEQYSKKDEIDTLFVGSSVGWVVVPRVIDENNGFISANMSTPNQFYKTSNETVRFISTRQPLKRVVLLTGFEGLENPEDYVAAEAFITAQYETAPMVVRESAIFAEKIGRYTDPKFLTSTDSMNIWFDWVEGFTYSFPEIIKNIGYRNGRRNKPYTLDITERYERLNAAVPGAATDEDIRRAADLNLSSLDIDVRTLKILDDMASYLAANDIRFTVIVTPHRSDVGAGYGGEYETIDAFFKDFVTKRGGEYYNIDADPDLRAQLPDEMFKDEEHIVDEGNNTVSMKIAELLR